MVCNRAAYAAFLYTAKVKDICVHFWHYFLVVFEYFVSVVSVSLILLHYFRIYGGECQSNEQ